MKGKGIVIVSLFLVCSCGGGTVANWGVGRGGGAGNGGYG